MRRLAPYIPIATGVLLVLYVVTPGGAWSAPSVRGYVLFSTAILNINLGIVGLALTGEKK